MAYKAMRFLAVNAARIFLVTPTFFHPAESQQVRCVQKFLAGTRVKRRISE